MRMKCMWRFLSTAKITPVSSTRGVPRLAVSPACHASLRFSGVPASPFLRGSASREALADLLRGALVCACTCAFRRTVRKAVLKTLVERVPLLLATNTAPPDFEVIAPVFMASGRPLFPATRSTNSNQRDCTRPTTVQSHRDSQPIEGRPRAVIAPCGLGAKVGSGASRVSPCPTRGTPLMPQRFMTAGHGQRFC